MFQVIEIHEPIRLTSMIPFLINDSFSSLKTTPTTAMNRTRTAVCCAIARDWVPPRSSGFFNAVVNPLAYKADDDALLT